MALNTFKCNNLTPLHFKGLKLFTIIAFMLEYSRLLATPPKQSIS